MTARLASAKDRKVWFSRSGRRPKKNPAGNGGVFELADLGGLSFWVAQPWRALNRRWVLLIT